MFVLLYVVAVGKWLQRWFSAHFHVPNVPGVCMLCAHAEVQWLQCLTGDVSSLLQNANTNKNLRNGEQVLDADEFVTFYMSLMSRSEVKDLFTRYTTLATLLGTVKGTGQNVCPRVRGDCNAVALNATVSCVSDALWSGRPLPPFQGSTLCQSSRLRSLLFSPADAAAGLGAQVLMQD
jgi:hypothetical protein